MMEGEEEAFERLFGCYHNKLYRMAYLICGNHADSEDIVQETFLKCYLNRNKLKNSSCSFPELTIDYTNGSRTVTVTASRPPVASGDSLPVASERFQGITVNYKVDHYKFVPEDYKLTEEDEKRIADGDLQVSYGTDRVELNDIPYVYWEQDGTNYLIMPEAGSRMSQADLTEMAKEVISSGKE